MPDELPDELELEELEEELVLADELELVEELLELELDAEPRLSLS